MTTGKELIAAERLNHAGKGYDAKHDDALPHCTLRQRASAIVRKVDAALEPLNRVRELTRAGALYLADAERCDRAKQEQAARVLRGKAGQCASEIDRLHDLVENESKSAPA